MAKDANWEFILCDAASLAKLDLLDGARNKKVEFVQNRPGSLGFSISLDDSKAHKILPQATAIRAVRNGETVWSGPVYTRTIDAASNSMTISCQGWLEDLYHRIVRMGQETVINAISNVIGGANVDDIIEAILDLANSQRSGVIDGNGPINVDGTSGDPLKPLRPVRVSWGGGTLTDTFNYPEWPKFQVSYTRSQRLGEMIQQLTDVENGADIEVDPLTRELHVYYPRRSEDRENVVFGYGVAPFNLKNVTRNEDFARSCQRFNASGRTGTYMAEDEDAMDDLGVMFEEEENLSDITDSDVMLAYSGAEVVIRSRGVLTDSITLFPWSDETDHGANVPQLFVDYNIGDTVYVSATAGFFHIHNQKMRIYGATVAIDENGNENIEAVQTSPTGA